MPFLFGPAKLEQQCDAGKAAPSGTNPLTIRGVLGQKRCAVMHASGSRARCAFLPCIFGCSQACAAPPPSRAQALRPGAKCLRSIFFPFVQRRWQSSASAARREARCPNCRHPRGSFCGPSLRRRRSSPRSRRRARVSGNGFLAAEELCERRSPQDRMRGSVYALRRSPEKVEAFSEYSRACSFPDSWQTL